MTQRGRNVRNVAMTVQVLHQFGIEERSAASTETELPIVVQAPGMGASIVSQHERRAVAGRYTGQVGQVRVGEANGEWFHDCNRVIVAQLTHGRAAPRIKVAIVKQGVRVVGGGSHRNGRLEREITVQER